MKTVRQVSKLTGVTVRALQYYDAIGLFKPTEVTAAGYRLYDDSALERLQCIMLFRELRFPLREIKAILDDPGFSREEALRQQLELLKLERQRLDELIDLAAKLANGDGQVSFTAFDRTRLDEYAAEAKKKWGSTPEFKEYERHGEPSQEALKGLEDIFVRIGKLRGSAPDSPEAQALVEELRRCITDNFYTCSAEMLRNLGEMYVLDARFTESIDQAGGEGTAQFVHDAIEACCGG